MEHGHHDESSERIERRAEKEEAAIWGMLPLMAIFGALSLLAVAMVPAWRPWLFFLLPIGVALVLLAVMLRASRRIR